MFELPRRHIDADAARTKTRELDRKPRRAAPELENVLPRDVPEDAEFAFRNRPAAPDNLVNAELLVVLGLVRVADPIPSGAVLCDVISCRDHAVCALPSVNSAFVRVHCS